jgi:arylsulfatase A-like enzyme
MKKSNLRSFATLLFFKFCIVTYAFAQPSGNRPNIILLMADDQGWNELGCYDHPLMHTPNIDKMADNGLRFERFYAASPICTPTRASVITGRHANRMGAFTWNYSLRPEEISIAQLLSDKGYHTAHFGKWHLGPAKKDSPTNPGAMGFDHWLSHDNYFGYNPRLILNGNEPQIYPGEGSELLVRESIEHLQSLQDEKPFFLVIWFGSPHRPYAGIDEDVGLYNKENNLLLRQRFAEITAMDRAVGRLNEFLASTGKQENTLVWFNSDNGVIDGEVYSPLRGKKGDLYEGGIRVPAIIQWPGVAKAGSTTDVAATTSDILPTLCDIVGIPLHDRPLDGMSIKSVIQDPSSGFKDRQLFFWNCNLFDSSIVYNCCYTDIKEPYLDSMSQVGTVPTDYQQDGIIFNNYIYNIPKDAPFKGEMAVQDGDFKLYRSMEGEYALYDLANDIGETNNLIEEMPEKAEPMKAGLHKWLKSVENSLQGNDY